jgi:hypothetical protein
MNLHLWGIIYVLECKSSIYWLLTLPTRSSWLLVFVFGGLIVAVTPRALVRAGTKCQDSLFCVFWNPWCIRPSRFNNLNSKIYSLLDEIHVLCNCPSDGCWYIQISWWSFWSLLVSPTVELGSRNDYHTTNANFNGTSRVRFAGLSPQGSVQHCRDNQWERDNYISIHLQFHLVLLVILY